MVDRPAPSANDAAASGAALALVLVLDGGAPIPSPDRASRSAASGPATAIDQSASSSWVSWTPRRQDVPLQAAFSKSQEEKPVGFFCTN
jgi:hypothetical protein